MVGYVKMPDPESLGPGRVAVEIEMDRDQLAVTLQKVQDLAAKLQQRQEGGVAQPAPAATAPPPPAPRPAAASQQPASQQPQAARPSPPAPSQPTVPAPAAVAPPVAVHMPQQRHVAAARGGGGGLQQQQQQQPGVRPWTKPFATSTGEHNSYPITSVVYAAALEGLPGGDGHGGWLISSSQNQCVLWECSRTTDGSEPPLLLMHSQETEFTILDMELSTGDGVMFGAGIATANKEPGVALHSLKVDDGFLAMRGQLELLCPAGVAPRHAGQQPHIRCVRSLRPLGGPLAMYVAVAVGPKIVLQPPSVKGKSEPGKALHEFVAHNGMITCVTPSAFHLAMVTGSVDGMVRVWDLKNRPNAPTLEVAVGGQVSAARFVGSNHLLTAGTSRTVQVWDVRRTAEPLQSVSPDGHAITSVAVDALHEAVAVVTAQGVHCCELRSGVLGPLSALPGGWVPGKPPTVATWNNVTGDLFVGGADGSVGMFRN